MQRIKKFALIILTLAIVVATICLFAVLFISANKNSNLTDAEITTEKVEELQEMTPQEEEQEEKQEEQTVHASSIQYASGQDTYTGGWNHAYLKVTVRYNDECVSGVSFSNVSVSTTWRSRSWSWDDAVFTVTPQSGYEWTSDNYSFYVYRSGDSSAYDNPSTYNWSGGTNYTFTRSGNTFTYTGGFSGSQNSISGDIRQSIYIDISSKNMFKNSWTPTPGISSWTYGQTASNPYGAALHGTMSYTYFCADALDYFEADSLAGKPTTPGRYYMYVSCWATCCSPLYLQRIQFYIYAPTPTVQNVYWTGSTVTAGHGRNVAYVNAPSGVNAGPNVGTYTATFTAKTISETYHGVNPDNGDEWDETFSIQLLFNNGQTSINLPWSILKRSLDIPTVSGSFTYDGNTKNATVTYRDSIQQSYITQTGTTSASNAGTYTVTFAITNTSGCQWSDGTIAQKSGTWTIARASVAIKPTLKDSGSYTYTGSAVNINTHVNNFNTSYMTVSNNSKTNAGSYTTTYTLNSNYAWTDGTTVNATVSWSITPKSLTKVALTASPTFTGSAVSPTLSNFDSNTMNKTGDTSATNVKTSGNYSITISLKNTTNYKWSDNTTASYTITWNVLPKDISGGTITITPTDYTYDGAEHKPTVTVTVP